MNKILISLALVCNVLCWASHRVPIFDTTIEKKSLVDSLLNCCEDYMSYEYGSLKKENLYCYLIMCDNEKHSCHFLIQDAFSDETPFLQNVFDIEKKGWLFFYDYKSMHVLMEIWHPECELIRNRDSIDFFTKKDARIYLEVVFAKFENSYKIIYYDNFKPFVKPDVHRWFSFENDTFFIYGRNREYPFENPFERDTSVIYLDQEESFKYLEKKVNITP